MMNTVRSRRVWIAGVLLLSALGCPPSTPPDVPPPSEPPPTTPETTGEGPIDCSACAPDELFCNADSLCICGDPKAAGSKKCQGPGSLDPTVAGPPSPPEGECSLEDWYCNASGVCHCHP
jgi:hypothetical protein